MNSVLIIYLISVYLLLGLLILNASYDTLSSDSNPLWRGFIFLFWPLWILYDLGCMFVSWCKDVRDYYKRKKEK